MAMFNSYVKLPEGRSFQAQIIWKIGLHVPEGGVFWQFAVENGTFIADLPTKPDPYQCHSSSPFIDINHY